MNCEKHRLWDFDDNVDYTAYLHETQPEDDGRSLRPAVIICPGGGYLMTSDREGEPVALFYTQHGFQAFVLRYITKDRGDATYPNALYDLGKMMLTIHENAHRWQVDVKKIAIIGFSAGAHLCASLAVHWQDAFLKNHLNATREQLKPAAVVLGYPLLDYEAQFEAVRNDPDFDVKDPINHMSRRQFMAMSNTALMGERQDEIRLREVSPVNCVSNQVPPVFIWHTAKDSLVYVINSLNFARQLDRYHVPFELHIFENGDHGLSLADERSAQIPEHINEDAACWRDMSIRFLRRHL